MAEVPGSVFMATVMFVSETGKKKRECDSFVCTNVATHRLSLNVEGMRGLCRVCLSCYESALSHRTSDLWKTA